MTPERWKQIDELFQALIEQPPSERSAFLDANCGDDTALRDEIDSLISLQEQAESFLEVPAKELALSVIGKIDQEEIIGKTLNSYEVIDRLGEGGMGEVYLAQDTRLDRKVALKCAIPARIICK